ncbi:ANTAR domain-containing protein [Streptomyces sp. NPDC090306]|uniref:ANTAR domain-containing protein n=1 Tax=Streptomyces sp. NPDC090306 TaxID=3365961 RepID=UPI003818C976
MPVQSGNGDHAAPHDRPVPHRGRPPATGERVGVPGVTGGRAVPRAAGHAPVTEHARVADLLAEETRGVPPDELPARLCAVAVDLLPVTGASVSLLYGSGLPVRLGASDPAAARLAELQATLGDGPGPRAGTTGAPVFASDLDGSRWPVLARQAAEAGVRAVYSIPLGPDTACLGSLDLYGDTPGALDAGHMPTALLLAGALTAAVLALARGEYAAGGEGPRQAGTPEEKGAAWLDGLVADHDTVFQAVGMIMVQSGAGPDEALSRLRTHAVDRGSTAFDVAREVLAHRVRFDPPR